jgi:hypothetical protein
MNSLKNCVIGLLFLLCFTLSVQAQKNDTIYLKNGDRITGELKIFEYGILTLTTDAMLKVYIEFDKINTIYSAKYFEMRTNSGVRHFGHLLKSNTPASLNIVTKTDTIPKPLWDIVQITPIKRSFFQKIDGTIDLGITYTKASDVFQYSLNLQATHRTVNYATRFNVSSILTDNGDGGVSRNNEVGVGLTRYLPNKWFARASTQGQQNTELDLDFRLQGGLGGGYDFVRTNAVRFYGMAGLVVNHEKTISSSVISDNIEALFAAQCKWFQYRHPKIDITTNLELYPSLTINGRVRFEYDISAKYEIVRDLFFNVQFYISSDSKPATGEISKSDWGVVTSIGYTF